MCIANRSTKRRRNGLGMKCLNVEHPTPPRQTVAICDVHAWDGPLPVHGRRRPVNVGMHELAQSLPRCRRGRQARPATSSTVASDTVKR